MFANLRIPHKLMVGFSAVILVLLVMVGWTSFTVLQLRATSEQNNVSSDVQDAITQALVEASNTARHVLSFGASGDVAYREMTVQDLKRMDAQLDRARKLLVDQRELGAMVANVTQKAQVWRSYIEGQIVHMTSGENREAINEAFRQNKGATSDLMKALLETVPAVTKWSDAMGRQEERGFQNLLLALGLGSLAALVLSVLAAWFITRSITSPLKGTLSAMAGLAGGDVTVEIPGVQRRDEVGDVARSVQTFKEAALAKLRLESEAEESRVAAERTRAQTEAERTAAAAAQAEVVTAIGAGLEALSQGDLTARLEQAFAADYEALRGNFNRAVEQLHELVAGIVGNIGGIRSGTGEIAQAADDLSRRTEQQAASLEETAAALEQITTTVRRTAEGAKHAGDAVGQARADADKSGVVVQDAVSAMSAIERSAQQISQIIGVIDEIAFQTNLLALNAGVEAARAGEAGRGFAVVASEVRALAQRSAEAAKEIKALISTSTQQVGRGVELVGETGRALGRIVSQVGEISTVVSEIAASAQEQATGLAEVNTAVNQMDQVTQQNAAMVEQSTAASHALAQETEQLAGLTGRFRLGAEVAVETRRAQPAQPRPKTRPALRVVSQSRKPDPTESWKEL